MEQNFFNVYPQTIKEGIVRELHMATFERGEVSYLMRTIFGRAIIVEPINASSL